MCLFTSLSAGEVGHTAQTAAVLSEQVTAANRGQSLASRATFLFQTKLPSSSDESCPLLFDSGLLSFV